MTQQTDRLIEDYLGAVSYACIDLPPHRRDELIEDLREHIAAARAELYQPSEAAIRTILDRLGEPSAIAEEARQGEPLGQPAAVPLPSMSVSLPGSEPVSRLSSATLGMWLGFALLVIVVLVLGAVLMMSNEPNPPSMP